MIGGTRPVSPGYRRDVCELARGQLPAQWRGLRVAFGVKLLWYGEDYVMDEELVLIGGLEDAQLAAIAAVNTDVAGIP